MKEALVMTAKVIGTVMLSISVFLSISDNEMAPFIGTLFLVVISSVLVFFSREKKAKLVWLCYLGLVVGISYSVDKYFWQGVWEKGYIWPYGGPPSFGGNFMGSIAPYIYQISIVVFAILAVIAIACGTWHLTRGSSRSFHSLGRSASHPAP